MVGEKLCIWGGHFPIGRRFLRKNENLWNSQLQHPLQLYELWFGVAELGVVSNDYGSNR